MEEEQWGVFQASIILCDSAPVQWFMVLPVMVFLQYQPSFHQDSLLTSCSCLWGCWCCWKHVLLRLHTDWLLSLGHACFLGQLMSTRSFDHRVGRGRGSRGDSHAGGSHFPWEPPVTVLLGLQVQGREDNSARSVAWEHGESAAPEALGKAATAWVTGHRAESQLCSFRERAVQKERKRLRLLRHRVTCGLADGVAFAPRTRDQHSSKPNNRKCNSFQ